MGFHTNNEEVGKVNKEVMIVTGAGQISMAIARRLGYGKKIIIGDKNIDNANRITKIMNDAGFDVIPVEMDLSSRKLRIMGKLVCLLMEQEFHLVKHRLKQF